MDTVVEHSISECRFNIVQDGKDVGYLTYSISDKVMDIRHTVVDPVVRGQGLGRILVDSAISYAENEGLTIIPSCSYAERIMSNK